MYIVAEKLAKHEADRFESVLNLKGVSKEITPGRMRFPFEERVKIAERTTKYRNERLAHHINEMNKLLMEQIHQSKETDKQ